MNSDNDTIVIEWAIEAPVDKVWEAWTNPTPVLKWFGSDPNGMGLSADMDVRPGGSYEIRFCDSDKTEHTCRGLYLIVEKDRHLSFSWSWKSEPGVESFVDVLFAGDGGSTNMKFSHSKVGQASKHNYVKGWQDTFRKLDNTLKNYSYGTK